MTNPNYLETIQNPITNEDQIKWIDIQLQMLVHPINHSMGLERKSLLNQKKWLIEEKANLILLIKLGIN